MEKTNHHISTTKSSLPGLLRIKNNKTHSNKKNSKEKNILQRIFHPDYILFDWEYFSRELEFE